MDELIESLVVTRDIWLNFVNFLSFGPAEISDLQRRMDVVDDLYSSTRK